MADDKHLNQDDVIIIGQNKVGFTIFCECGEKHFHEIVGFTTSCPKCKKKQKLKVKDLPEFTFNLLKNPIWLTLIKFQSKNKLRIQSNEFNRPKQADFIKMFEEIGLRSNEVGYTEGFNRNKGKKMQVYEIELRKRIF